MKKTDVPMGVKITVESGIVCYPIDEFHEAAEDLMGYSIWLHEFAIPEIWLDLKVALLLREMGFRYRGNRAVDPETTMRRLKSDANIIAV